MYRKLTAIAMSVSMLLGTLPVMPAVAEDGDLPEWVPQSFLEAWRFEDAHGATYTSDGMICVIQKMDWDGTTVDTGYSLRSEGTLPDPVFEKLFTFDIDESEIPDFNSKTFFEDRVAFVEKYGISVEETGFMRRTAIRLYVYKPEQDGTVALWWQKNGAEENTGYRYTFETAAGVTTETDLYGWVPDCPTEFNDYKKEHGEVSCRDNYIIYCGSVSYAAGCDFVINRQGDAEAEQILRRGLTRQDGSVGGPSSILIVYEAKTPGELMLSFDQVWNQSEYTHTVSDVGCFRVNDDLSVEQLPEDYFEIHHQPILGDVNFDGKISVLDIIMLQRYLLGSGELKSTVNADLNSDGSIDIFDMVYLKRTVIKTQQSAEDPTEPPTQPVEDPTEPATDPAEPTEAPTEPVTDPAEEVLVSSKNLTKSDYGTVVHFYPFLEESDMVICSTLDEYRAAIWKDPNLFAEPDEAFFEENSIVLIRTYVTSGSHRTRMVQMTRTGDTLTAHVLMQMDPVCTTDMASHCFVYKIAKADIAGVTTCLVDIDKQMIEDPGMDY